jgi:hypothetical protein
MPTKRMSSPSSIRSGRLSASALGAREAAEERLRRGADVEDDDEDDDDPFPGSGR